MRPTPKTTAAKIRAAKAAYEVAYKATSEAAKAAWIAHREYVAALAAYEAAMERAAKERAAKAKAKAKASR